ncbi:hypothetical protein ACEW7V_00230 [Areca yellow leaf disease phytoplasma]|uniref:hypothetical protein n=1 Tax=Areca yellow leaf disease phytoplasma TaxID=927614 RepID=UPI0035B532C4
MGDRGKLPWHAVLSLNGRRRSPSVGEKNGDGRRLAMDNFGWRRSKTITVQEREGDRKRGIRGFRSGRVLEISLSIWEESGPWRDFDSMRVFWISNFYLPPGRLRERAEGGGLIKRIIHWTVGIKGNARILLDGRDERKCKNVPGLFGNFDVHFGIVR